MLYSLNDRILPAYHRENYHGPYQVLHRTANGVLLPNVIEALHYHSCMEIGFCLCGSGVTHVDNRIYSFSEGDLQIVPPNVPHLSAAAPGVETRWQWISFDPLEILERSGCQHMAELCRLCEESFAGVFRSWEYPRLADILYRFRDAAAAQDAYSHLEYAFLSGQLLIECARIGREAKNQTPDRDCVGKLQPAVLYIREHFSDKEAMREENIAATCAMSVSHFRAVFKRETGMCVRDFIIQTRLAKAAHLLKNTDASVLSVAMESGFGQASCFNRIFVRVFGQTPSSFRKRFKGM